MSDYHEPVELIDEHARDCTRAISSMKEELEAVDWYNQRVSATKDESLKAILIHNRDEEIEHACMILEWLRRNMDAWDEELRTYLFKDGDITALEAGSESPEPAVSSDSSLGVGKMKK